MSGKDRIYFNTFLERRRKEKSLTMEQLGKGLCSVSMLKRIETGERLPDKMLRDRLLDRLGVANDGFDDFLWPDEYAMWQNRKKLLWAVSQKDTEKAEKILSSYRWQDVGGNRIERQFYLVMQAQVMQARHAGQEQMKDIYQKALDCTLSGFEIKRGEKIYLAVQEWDLLLDYIRCGGALERIFTETGDVSRAAAYEMVLSALRDADMDSYCSAKIYPKAVYYLCQEWRKEPSPEKPYDRILQICVSAVELLRSTNRMFFLDELLELMEQTADELQEGEGGPEFLSAGILPEQIRSWRETLEKLYRGKHIPARTENCAYLYWQTRNHNMGEIIRKRRKMLGMSAARLCKGICDEKTLRRLESGKYKTQRSIVAELFKRLGLSPEYQQQKILTEKFEAFLLHDKVIQAFNNRDTDTLVTILPQLKEMLSMDVPANQLEMERLESRYLQFIGKITGPEMARRMKRTLENTVSLERIRNAEEGYLSYGEMECIHTVAVYAGEGEREGLMELLRILCERLTETDGIENNISIYELMMGTVSSYLGNIGDYAGSDQISDSILERDLLLRRMTKLSFCVYNRLWNYREQKKENGLDEDRQLVEKKLEECVQLARLGKETFLERFFLEEQSKLGG